MTRRSFVAVGLAAALAAAGTARAAGPEDAVIAAQDKRVALTIAADVAGLGAMMTDDLTYMHSSANLESKAEFLEGLRSGKYKYKAMTFEDRKVRFYGDVAVVSGLTRVQVTSGGRDLDIKLRFTELYAKQQGAWKMALWQSTRVPDATP
jgi:ketosteroid isomerase-like protein